MPRLFVSYRSTTAAFLFAVLGLTSCAREGRAPAVSSSAPGTAAGSRSNAPSRSPSASTNPESPGNAPRASANDADGPNAFRLVLPHDRAFLERVLPGADRARYAQFREKKRISVGYGYLYGAELLADGASLLVRSAEERSVRIYERSSGSLRTKIPIPGSEDYQASALAWPELGPAGTPLVLTASAEGLRLSSAKDGAELGVVSPKPADSVVFSPDGKVLCAIVSKVPEQQSTLTFYLRDGLELRSLGELVFAQRVDGAALSRDNRLLAVSHYPADELRVIDLAMGADVLRVPAPRYAGSVDFSPDGRFVAIGGDGLLVVDLLDPSRRAYFDQIYNNIGAVRFSPSGDAIAASAYDGRLRILAYGLVQESSAPGRERLTLQLLKELRHAGTANVYNFSFDPDGRGLVSASGDRTVRWFRDSAQHAPSASDEVRFQSLEQWRAAVPAPLDVPIPEAPKMVDGILIVPALSQPPRPTRLAPGVYDCKITKIYRMRDCIIERLPSGHTWLRFEPGNLFSLAGVVYDDGDVVRFEGSLTERSELLSCRDCEKQPIHGLLRGPSQRLEGVLVIKNYYDPLNPPEQPAKDIRIEETHGRFPIELSLRRKQD